MKNITLLVGPSGSGKSTHAKALEASGYVRISQDDQGRDGHFKAFLEAVNAGSDIVVDRPNFYVVQRERYLVPAREAGYTTKIVVLHVPKKICMNRCNARQDHPTIKTPEDASRALNMFFRKYERVQDFEADVVERLGWEHAKDYATVFDIDNTMANAAHREHFINGANSILQRKKDWKSFFEAGEFDTPNVWCQELFWQMQEKYPCVFVSARPDDYNKLTEDWLQKHNLDHNGLFLRERGDFRQDAMIKETILDFELLPRYKILFVVDDRKVVTDMFRRRGLTVLHCAPGEF
jgi:dephospho-CoA kinase